MIKPLYNTISAMYNDRMDNTRYYFDSDNECVLAYDRATDFFLHNTIIVRNDGQ